MENKKYRANIKNGGKPPLIKDQRTRFVPIGCGMCIECKKQKSREWQVRLQEEIKTAKNGKFITLTFSNESIIELNEAVNREEEIQNKELSRGYTYSEGYERDNRIATLGIRRFMERWRKEFGDMKNMTHWLVTELGHKGTENIHIHGILWTEENWDKIEKIWRYGYMYPKEEWSRKKNCVNETTVNYIIKYINKVDKDHRGYKPKILSSKGIGKNYINRADSNINKYNNKETQETYITRQGIKLNLPIYYRNKLWSEEERETLWINKLDKNIRYIRGEKVDISKGEEEYIKLLKWHQKQSEELGYKRPSWDEIKYENERRNLLRDKRINNNNNKKEEK